MEQGEKERRPVERGGYRDRENPSIRGLNPRHRGSVDSNLSQPRVYTTAAGLRCRGSNPGIVLGLKPGTARPRLGCTCYKGRVELTPWKFIFNEIFRESDLVTAFKKLTADICLP